MSTSEKIDLLVADGRESARWQVGYTCMIVTVGLTILALVSFVFSLPVDHLKAVLGIAGGFIGAVGAVPIKDLLSIKRKCRWLLRLRQEYAQPDGDRAWIETTVRDIVKKEIGG